jgi:hypothetical protein
MHHKQKIFLVLVVLSATVPLLMSCDSATEPQDGTNHPPSAPAMSQTHGCPPDGAVDQLIHSTLRWTCSDPDGDALTFDVHLGPDGSEPIPLVSTGQCAFQYTTVPLEVNTAYRWQIVARDARGAATASPIWTFTTRGEDTIPPMIRITNPAYDSDVSDTIMITASADDNYGVISVDFYVDGQLLFADRESPWRCMLPTTVYLDSTEHFIEAVATDDGDNTGIQTLRFMVFNDNRPPQTFLFHEDICINTENEDSPLPGIRLGWSASDDGNAPPEYEWRLYGPYDTAFVVPLRVIYDNGELMATVDLDALPATIGDLSQPLRHSRGSNFDTDSTDVWVSAPEETLYDVFRDLTIENTCAYKFIAWVRARDDRGLTDQSPAFGEFLVYEAMFERGVAVFDETGYTRNIGRWAPTSMDTCKAVLRRYIIGAGYTDFDTTSGTDYFFTATRKDVQGTRIQAQWPTLIDVLSHKLIIFFNDDSDGLMSEYPWFGLLPWIYFGMDAGIPTWVLARDLAEATTNIPAGKVVQKSYRFEKYFGIQTITAEGWIRSVIDDPFNPVFNEEFIGAAALVGDLPGIDVDFSLLESRYPRFFLDTSHIMQGLPEVGVATPGEYAVPLHQYVSRHGTASAYQDGTCAVRQNRDGVRSACWLFTPIAMEIEPMQQAFTATLEWLTQPDKAASSDGLRERRERIVQFLEDLTTARPASDQ